jgi:hypothetical protein
MLLLWTINHRKPRHLLGHELVFEQQRLDPESLAAAFREIDRDHQVVQDKLQSNTISQTRIVIRHPHHAPPAPRLECAARSIARDMTVNPTR